MKSVSAPPTRAGRFPRHPAPRCRGRPAQALRAARRRAQRVATWGTGGGAEPARAEGWRALPAAPGHPPCTAHFPAAAPSPPSAPGGPGAGRRRRRGRAVRSESGEPSWLDSAGGIAESPLREVVDGVRMAGGWGVRLGGGARDARRHMEDTESGAVSVAPPHAPLRPRLPPPAGTSGFADWLMCPWKWLFKKLSQQRKIVIRPSSHALVELSSRISITYCGPEIEET
ncbi:taperin-like [Eschrichtius robustus]|uniref:taperin-like n=1 Tax=Eschrichtius robustus TaxID=9764 RepID=UPI0035BF47D0